MLVPALRTPPPVTGPEQLPLRRMTGVCGRCGQHTLNALAEWVTPPTGPNYRRIVHANPAECARPPDYPDGGQPAALVA